MRGKRGFTLTEILVALAIFALGGTAIMALFITNIRLSRQAMDYTRAAEITRNARSLMTQAVSRPIVVGDNDRIYQFSYPGTSLTLDPKQYREQFEQSATTSGVPDEVGGSAVANSIFFRLPTEPFNANALTSAGERMVVKLPSNGLQGNGSPRSWESGDPLVFRFKPDMLRRSGALDGLDADDRMAYQFDLQVRRSVLRAGLPKQDGTGGMQPLEDLFVVHIRVYKGFEFNPDVQNDPYFEWDFYVSATR
ncbi:MAG: type II secretion system protein [Planctomycetes bacterium]|nr:type II secretion system protein [Planctomycetota bacterium]MCW8135193.1 type II secretion system protein [Planctomycetota bacterium]